MSIDKRIGGDSSFTIQMPQQSMRMLLLSPQILLLNSHTRGDGNIQADILLSLAGDFGYDSAEFFDKQ